MRTNTEEYGRRRAKWDSALVAASVARIVQRGRRIRKSRLFKHLDDTSAEATRNVLILLLLQAWLAALEADWETSVPETSRSCSSLFLLIVGSGRGRLTLDLHLRGRSALRFLPDDEEVGSRPRDDIQSGRYDRIG